MAYKRWQKWAAISGGTLILLFLLFGVVLYGPIGRYIIESKAIPRVENMLGRSIDVGAIDVSRGHAVLRDVKVLNDDGTTLATIDSISVDFSYWQSLVGSIDAKQATVSNWRATLHTDRAGHSNYGDILERLRKRRKGGGAGSSIMPSTITFVGGSITWQDLSRQGSFTGTGIDGTFRRGRGMRGTVAALHLNGPLRSHAAVQNVDFEANRRKVRLALSNAQVNLGVRLSAMDGDVTLTRQELVLDVDGSFAGSKQKLWSAKGKVNLQDRSGLVRVEAQRFNFARLEDVLKDNKMFLDYQKTELDTSLTIDFKGDEVFAEGSLDIADANIMHPKLASDVLRDVSFQSEISATYRHSANLFELHHAKVTSKEAILETQGIFYGPGSIDEETGLLRTSPRLTAGLKIPKISCAKLKRALPKALIPQLETYKLKGTFKSDLTVDIDWADLDNLSLKGGVGIRSCRVTNSEDTRVANLEGQFLHTVEVEQDTWREIVIGPDNPDYVPLEDISIHLRNSLQTTEDSRFYRHRGFIISEFRTALRKNLKAKKFKYGASSITMQLVKNVFLYRQKTLSRKLQELFLTWHVETFLDKDRILEVYLNVIEYGPNLYGIGPATQHYFGKAPSEITPREAAFFSSILPNPKRRYKQYCKGEVWNAYKRKIDRILKTMHKRKRLTEEEMTLALGQTVVFDGPQSEEAKRKCYKRSKDIIENQRPTSAAPPEKRKPVTKIKVKNIPVVPPLGEQLFMPDVQFNSELPKSP